MWANRCQPLFFFTRPKVPFKWENIKKKTVYRFRSHTETVFWCFIVTVAIVLIWTPANDEKKRPDEKLKLQKTTEILCVNHALIKRCTNTITLYQYSEQHHVFEISYLKQFGISHIQPRQLSMVQFQ